MTTQNILARKHPQRSSHHAWLYLLNLVATGIFCGLIVSRGAMGGVFLAQVMPVAISVYFGRLKHGLLTITVIFVVSELMVHLAWPADEAAHSRLPMWSMFFTVVTTLCLFSELLHRARQRSQIGELRQAAMLANVGDAVVVTDHLGRIDYMNSAAVELSQLPADQVRGKPFDDVFNIHDEQAQSRISNIVSQALQRAITVSYSGQTLLRRRDGTSVPVEVVAAPMHPAIRTDRPGTDSDGMGGVVMTLRNRSDQRRTESALQEQLALRERLTNIVLLVPGAVHTFEHTANGHLAMPYASPQFARIYGCDPELLRRDATLIMDSVHPDDLPILRETLASGARDLRPVHIEYRLNTPHLGLVWVELNAVPQPDLDGGTLWHGISTDITSRKLIERNIRENEACLTGVIASAIDAIITFDEQRGILLFNAAAERMFICQQGAMLGQTLAAFFATALPECDDLLKRLQQSDMTDIRLGEVGNVFARRSDGRSFPLEASISRSQVNSHQLLTMSLRDITERKLAEDQLHASQTQLRAALEGGALGVMQIAMAEGLVDLDETASNQWGINNGSDKTRTPIRKLLEAIHPQDRSRVLIEYRSAMRERDALRIECRVCHADGAIHWLVFRGRFSSVNRHRGRLGRHTMLTCVIADISFRKQIEEQQLRSQKLEALGVLAGGIAHDFNNLLLAIFGNIKLASTDLGAEHPAQISLQEALKAATRATALVRRILAFSRPQDHRLELLEINPVITEVVELARAILPAGIAIQCLLPTISPIVWADSDQIHQAILNLFTNAADALPKVGGKIELQIAIEGVNSDAGTRPHLRPGQYVRVSVIDNGHGMDAETAQRIFDPFFTTKPSGQGTGLGLAIVHGIMAGHQGTVTISSTPGEGAAFHLYFPAQHGDVVSTKLPVVLDTAIQRRARVLYLDDEEALVFLMKRTLQRMGHEIVSFSIASEALHYFHSHADDFDLILTDLAMPEMSGLDFARAVLASRPGIPVIITSGFITSEDEQAALAAGVTQIILKPNSVDELAQVLTEFARDQKV